MRNKAPVLYFLITLVIVYSIFLSLSLGRISHSEMTLKAPEYEQAADSIRPPTIKNMFLGLLANIFTK